MPKKKRQKKEKIVEGTPIEVLEYHGKEMEDLQKHAVKVGEELNIVRKERMNLEIDRDNMSHYYGNTVYQLMKVEREIRRAERNLIHIQGMGEGDLGKKVDIQPYFKLNKEREGYVGLALDRYREVFKAEGEIRGDRLRLRKEAWERALDGEVALMKVKHRARAREIGRIGEAYTAAILEAEKEAEESDQRLFERLEEAADRDFRRMILVKNKQVSDMRQSHADKVEDLRDAYGELKYSQQTLRYREEAIRLTGETTHLGNMLAEYREFYIKYKRVRDSAEEQARGLLEIEAKQEELENEISEKKRRHKELEEYANNLMLETNLLEDFKEINEEMLKSLRKDCFSEVKKTRLKHMRICHAMDILRQQLLKELAENKSLLHLYSGQGNDAVGELLKKYERRLAEKATIADLADMALREQGVYACDLDLPHRAANSRRPFPPRPPAKVPIGRMLHPAPTWDSRKYGVFINPAVLRKKKSSLK